jgi:hypothetical protein
MAAFSRLTGLPTKNVIGASFSSLLQQQAQDKINTQHSSVSLADCVVSTNAGNHKSLQLRVDPSSATESLVCRIQASPIVARKTKGNKVTHFAIEVVGESEELTRRSSRDDDIRSTTATEKMAVFGVVG